MQKHEIQQDAFKTPDSPRAVGNPGFHATTGGMPPRDAKKKTFFPGINYY